ncbi:MAG: hypothetical protein MOB07_14575 [Acidobacteria bacterium]|nr:hypothetical protein [Acidobacteriota bacterium]
MKTRKMLWKAIVLVMLVAACVAWASASKKDKLQEIKIGTGLIGVTKGQIVRLNVANVFGTEGIRMELTLLDNGGKVLIQCNGLVLPGMSLSDEFTPQCCDGTRTEVRAVVRIIDPDDRRVIDEVAPTLEVIDDATGKDSSFVELRPIFNPPLAELFR